MREYNLDEPIVAILVLKHLCENEETDFCPTSKVTWIHAQTYANIYE